MKIQPKGLPYIFQASKDLFIQECLQTQRNNSNEEDSIKDHCDLILGSDNKCKDMEMFENFLGDTDSSTDLDYKLCVECKSFDVGSITEERLNTYIQEFVNFIKEEFQEYKIEFTPARKSTWENGRKEK